MEGKNNPAQWGGLDGKKNSGQRRSVFSLTPFMELTRTLPRGPAGLRLRDQDLLRAEKIEVGVTAGTSVDDGGEIPRKIVGIAGGVS
jgi:hypothetical protein